MFRTPYHAASHAGLFDYGILRKPNLNTLTDTKLHNLKPKDVPYNINDRDGLYVAVTPADNV